MTVHVAEVVALALAQLDDAYVFGAEARASDPDPDAWDCSELIEWACHRLGVAMPDGSKNQLAFCDQQRQLMQVGSGIATFGALLFRMSGSPTHVALSLGDGRTIEARGRDYGVGVFSAYSRGWTHAAHIPGVTYYAEADEEGVDPVKLDEVYASLKGATNAIAAEVERRTNLLDADTEAIKRDVATVSAKLDAVLDLLGAGAVGAHTGP